MSFSDNKQDCKDGILDKIKKYRQAVLLASAGAFLHNLGKVSREFNLDHQKTLEDGSGNKQYYYYQHISGLLKSDADKAGFDLVKDFLIEDDTKRKFNSENDNTLKVFGNIIDLLQKKLPCNFIKPFNDRIYRLGDFLEYLGQGKDWGRLYFRKEATSYNEHKIILENIDQQVITADEHPYYIHCILGTTSFLTHLMSICHRAASGGEKDKFYFKYQRARQEAFISSPFGHEYRNASVGYVEYKQLKQQAEDIIHRFFQENIWKRDMLDLSSFIEALKSCFKKAMADSRRPFNNVSVYDMGHSGMALLKSGIWSLAEKPVTHDSFWKDESEWLRWRLLRFGLDGLNYLAESISIADLRVRKSKLKEYLNRVQSVLEEEYPIATEVYRDENGSILVFPNWSEESEEYRDIQEMLRHLDVEAKSSINRSLPSVYGIRPRVQLSLESYMAHPEDARQRERPYIGTALQEWILNPAESEPHTLSFHATGKIKGDLCPYCSLREIGTEGGHDRKQNNQARRRKICTICMEERNGEAKHWWVTDNRRDRTIWIDEVADNNRRIALIVGRFYPEFFIRSDCFPVGEGQQNSKLMSAEAFARNRRIWESCREFWVDIKKSLPEALGRKRRRLIIQIEVINNKDNDLRNFNAYELTGKDLRLRVMWTGDYFVTIENLEYYQKNQRKNQDIIKWLIAQTDGQEIQVNIPGGYGSKPEEWGKVKIRHIDFTNDSYVPTVSILQEPRTFMVLVPAEKAIQVVRKIKQKYEVEMGQVRSRLPLCLGAIFANSHTPLRAILDAGRRLLQRQPKPEPWIFAGYTGNGSLYDNQPSAHNQSTCSLKFTDPSRKKREICWTISKVAFGDPGVTDVWYPYFLVDKLVDGVPENNVRFHTLQLPIKNINSPEIKYMIHANKLKIGDSIWVYPSTFDFEHLDSSGTRFEITYDHTGKRRGVDKSHRPYLLEQVDALEEMWEILKRATLNRNQIYTLRDAIVSKRQEWEFGQEKSDTRNVYWQFCRNMLINANWNKVYWFKGDQKKIYPWEQSGENHQHFFDRWADYVVWGWFEDLVQLRLQILKEKIRGEEE